MVEAWCACRRNWKNAGAVFILADQSGSPEVWISEAPAAKAKRKPSLINKRTLVFLSDSLIQHDVAMARAA